MIKKINSQKKEFYLLLILLLISIVISNLGILGIADPRIMPNYFIGLVIAFIISNKAKLNLFKLMALGLIIDLLSGQLLGQHALIFITIYILHFIINKLLIIKTEIQYSSLSIFLIMSSFLILWLTSQSHDIFRPANLLFLQGILTFFSYLIIKIIIMKFSSK